LFVVATPIGNLEDLSPRARAVLAEVDLVAAEDTRVTGRLLSHFGIKTPQTALHEHNEDARARGLIERLRSGESIALVSDAGTPLISDPGFRVVRAAHEAGIAVSPIPGPSALLSAMSASGMPTDRFVFEGFLPSKSAARRRRLSSLAHETRPVILFESVHRVSGSLADLADVFGEDRAAFVARELTKLHEQCVAGTLADLVRRLAAGEIPLKGEFVIVVSGAAEDDRSAGSGIDADALLEELVAVLPGKQAAAIVSRLSGAGRNETYEKMLALKGSKS
jgi:16S rRNA (cytidine1402-2'-O)-methyltransferase